MLTDETEILIADYANERHGKDIVELLDGYAQDPWAPFPLTESVRASLILELQKRPNLFSVLAYVDGQRAGLTNCIETFSTFAARDVINIHDVFVVPAFRGRGLCRKMFDVVAEVASQKNCCKLTLEVLEANHAAQQIYLQLGFDGYELDPQAGRALFWQRKL